MEKTDLQRADGYWIGRFQAMASPCEILLEVDDEVLAAGLLNIAKQEALRIENKFSRYRTDNIIYKINHANGSTVTLDEETAHLMDYANECYQLSEGRFDITSGVLRKVWKFDGSDNIPSDSDIRKLMPYIGWQKVNWQSPAILLPVGMEIDVGGIGKEYAVDRTALLLAEHMLAEQNPAKQFAVSFLVNYGGDIRVYGPRRNGRGWYVGIENINGSNSRVLSESKTIEIKVGAIATSGDARRYLLKNNIRYSHILDPLTGWPVKDAPRSVTVVADTCTEAGILSTLAMLQGKSAELFLDQQGVKYWCER